MKYTWRIRSRMQPEIPIVEKHQCFLRRLNALHVASVVRDVNIPTPDIKHHLVAIQSLNPHLCKPFRGDVSYSLRSRQLEDKPVNDDRILLTFNPEKVDYAAIVRQPFDELVRAFDAYVGEIYHQDFSLIDFERFKTVNSRYGVYRVMPISFYNGALCRSAFSLTPAEVVARLGSHVEEVIEMFGGVKIVITSKLLPLAELEERTCRITELLTGRPFV